VHIDISKDATASTNTANFDYSKPLHMPTYKPTFKGNANQIKKAIDAMRIAKKPLLYIGGGAISSGSAELIREFIKKTKIPAVETLMARGVLSIDDKLLIGMLGMHGEYSANMAMYESDLIISFGARFDDRVTGNRLEEFGKFAKIIHIDIDPSQVSKVVHIDYPIVGDLKNVLTQMMVLVNDNPKFGDYSKWQKTIIDNKTKEPLKYIDSDESSQNGALKPQWVIQQIGKFFKDKATISTDVGQHQMWAAQFYPFTYPRQFITSGGLGTMGFGLPAAMGCALGNKQKIAINITGDGSFLMNIQELVTCEDEGIKVINIILNNKYLGMVRQWQTFFYDDRYSQTDLDNSPNFVAIAKGFGALGMQVTKKDELIEALQKAMDSEKSSIIDIITDRKEEVFPMVATNKAINDMYLLKDGK
jgi:acetolactate synthase-1/2/3 large subunit